MTVEFINDIPQTKDLIYKLIKNTRSQDFVLYTCRNCGAKSIFSGRKLIVKSKSNKKKINKSLLKDVLKSNDKETGFQLLDFLKSV